eukprot:GHVL01010998.1.p1 GENE.GHVL01010998.1~~GHVL01010998.1.p1  ORF type:complete len:432 (+),score=53.45 GHVL01010998.1:46-1341(+)
MVDIPTHLDGSVNFKNGMSSTDTKNVDLRNSKKKIKLSFLDDLEESMQVSSTLLGDETDSQNCISKSPNLGSLTNERFRDENMSQRTKKHGIIQRPQSDTGLDLVAPSTWSVAHNSVGGRKTMEDRHVMIPDFSYENEASDVVPPISSRNGLNLSLSMSYYAVFDGHGGKHASDYAAKFMHRHILHQLTMSWDANSALTSSFLQLDKDYLECCKRNGCKDGCTALVCLIRGKLAHLAHVGDCRAIMARSTTGFRESWLNQYESPLTVRLTEDHKPSRASEARRIHKSGGCVIIRGCARVCAKGVSRRLAVSRALGNYEIKQTHAALVIAEPEINVIKLTPNDIFLVLASDGVWDTMTDEFVVKVISDHVRKHFSIFEPSSSVPVKHELKEVLSSAALRVIDMAQNKGSTDNLTCVIVMLDWTKTDPQGSTL